MLKAANPNLLKPKPILLKFIFKIFLAAISLLLFEQTRAQLPVIAKQSNFRIKKIMTGADSVLIDTFSIVPKTFRIKNIPAADYSLDEVKAVLRWIKKPLADSFEVSYRVFPFQWNAVLQHNNYDSLLKRPDAFPLVINDNINVTQKNFFDFGTLKAEGSFGRQIGFGNSQGTVVNSNLNLQLSGLLGDSIEIQAAITDNNIPIQPDGTTQQLNEFDQVYLQFKKKNWQLSLGDIDIRQNQSYFLNFYKRLQGIAFKTENAISKNVLSKSLASASIAKGKFTRNVFQGLEGNQGPYRMTGANNEFFFIVLANTERVFLDGELLQRGQDQDYVINYNSAEITFTPRRLITKDSRIQVEFEYADRNYLNANLYLSQEFDFNNKLKLRIGAFSNSDARNSTINQSLDNNQKQFLANLGDSIQNAYYPIATVDSFSADKILYARDFNGVDSFYRYSTNPDSAKYNLSFVDVKQGHGDYIPDFNGANGKVYKYVAPVAGVKQGQFEPAEILVTPKTQQVLSIGMDYAINKNILLKTELAASRYDINTFSKKDKGNDKGVAAKIQLNGSRELHTTAHWQLNSSIDYEYVQKQFSPLERLRTVEFSRDWGLPLVLNSADENILRLGGGVKNNVHLISYQFTNYHRSDTYNGFQNSISQLFNKNGWVFNDELIITNYHSSFDRGIFIRPTLDWSKRLTHLKNWRLGLRYALEQNTQRNSSNDTLTGQAFSFYEYNLYARSDENKKNKLGITFYSRTTQYPLAQHFLKGDRSYNLNLQASLLKNPHRQLLLNTTFRKLKVFDSVISKQKDDRTILGRIEYNMNEWKGFLNGSIFYEVGAGQEQKKDYAYLEVPAGRGQYAWIDYNNDGVQQLNEFELAAFPDQAKFIRIYTPTNIFIKANYVTLNYRFDLNPRMLMKRSGLKGMKDLLSRINFLTALQTNRKSIAAGNFEFNPFEFVLNDTALITSFSDILNTFSFNRMSSRWGFDLSNHRSNGKSLLTYGYESRKLVDWLLRTRWNVSKNFSWSMNLKKGSNALYTPQFANRNYQLDIYQLAPFFTFLRGSSFRLILNYQLDYKKNTPLYGGEISTAHSMTAESRYNILQSSSFNAKFTFSNIIFKYPANTTVSYIMLDGLLPGKNYLWSLGFTKRLLNNLELSVNYDGRKAGSSRTVNIGRASLNALF